MQKAIFETASLVDAIRKAARIAPNKGDAFDKAAGVVIEIDPSDTHAVVYATDLHLTYRQRVSVVEMPPDKKVWRLPSTLISSFVATLPMSPGSRLTLGDNDDKFVYFICGATKAKFRTIDGSHPGVEPFDPAGLGRVKDLAQRLKQVAWAVDKKSFSALSCVHFDGEFLYGCDKANLAMVPCKVPVGDAISAPIGPLASIIKDTSEIEVRAADGRLQLMTDPDSQASAVLHADAYPNVKALMDKWTLGLTKSFKVNRELLEAVLSRMLTLVAGERFPVTSFHINRDFITLQMDVPDIGHIHERVPVEGGTDDGIDILFPPDVLVAALGVAGGASVTCYFGTALEPLLVDDGLGFKTLIMPRRKGTP